MGYTITIGQAEPFHDASSFPELYATWDVKGEHHDNAPAFGEPTDYTNQRWPSYTAWSNFCHAVGLYDFFYEDGRFRGGHPGCFQINQADADMISEKVKSFEVKTEDDQWHMNRLIWLEYWMQWAVKNCRRPAIGNT